MVIHGGDVSKVAQEYNISADCLLDFSANINPRGLPRRALERLRRDANDCALLARYPDSSYPSLRHALAQQDDISPDSVLIAEGAEALIGAVLRGIKPTRCLLPMPAFGEYQRACASSGLQIQIHHLGPLRNFELDVPGYAEQFRSFACDCAIINNPHNPSGALLPKRDLIGLVEQLRAAGAFVLIDEAFIDYARAESIVSYASRASGVVVIRSLTKFFGCPALRIGYAVGCPGILDKIARVHPAWPVTTLAANTLEEALEDDEFRVSTLLDNESERRRLAQSLEELGAHVTPSAANFLLIRLQNTWPDGATTREYLIRHHRIIVRNCDSFIGLEPGRYIRVAVRTARDNNLLLAGLRELWQ